MHPKDAAMRKRTQISNANRMMFVWVAGASVIVGFAIVGAIFLAQKLLFNERVLAQKQSTISTLDADNKAVPSLQDQVRVLNTNQALIDSKANTSDQAVQAILDALPSDANSLAFGASLQQRLLANIPNLTIQALQVDPVVGVESLSADSSSAPAATSDTTTADGSVSSNVITFSFSVSGDPTALKQVLVNIEKSIRPINILTLKIDSGDTSQTMSITGETYYEPAVQVKLTSIPVK